MTSHRATAGARGPILTVTANPALDQTYTVKKLTPGGSHRVPPPLTRAGGKGLNVARVIHQTGNPTVAIAPTGGTTGDEFAAELQRSTVPHTLVPVAAPTRRSTAFFDEDSGQTSIFNEYGENPSPDEWKALAAAIEHRLPEAAALVGSGSLPPGAPEDFYPRLVSMAAAHRLPSIIDTSGSALLAAAGAGADVLKPNHHELLDATGEDTIDDAAAALLALGAKWLFVSCGEEGMRLYDHRNRTWSARPPQLTGNATGAGDAAVAAIAVALTAGLDPTRVLRRACAWSASAVLMPAAGELAPNHRELEQQVDVTEISILNETER